MPESGVGDVTLRYLARVDLAAWEALVDVSPQGSVFSRSWWLGALGGEVKILGCFKAGKLLAGIPLYFDSRFGIRLCKMPKLTQTLGPVLPPANGARASDSFLEAEILDAIARHAAALPVFFQAFHPSLQNWAPFYWQGFSQQTRLTHIIEVGDLDKVWENFTKKRRRGIHSAERAGVKVTTCDPDTVWRQEEKTFARQNMAVPHSMAYLRGLYQAARDHNAGECFAAVDKQQRIHSAHFVVWDEKRMHAIAGGSDQAIGKWGSTALLEWETMRFAAGKSRIYDFTGSMLKPVELFIRGYGTTRVPYHWIFKVPLPLKLYLAARGKI
jgi:hypothetical protein